MSETGENAGQYHFIRLRIPAVLHEKISDIAKQNCRTVTGEIVATLRMRAGESVGGLPIRKAKELHANTTP